MSAHDSSHAPSRALRLAFYGLLAVLVLAPLPFGSNRMWAWSLLSIGTGLLLALWAWGVARTPGALRIPWSWHLPATVSFALAIAWFFIQASGMTPGGWDNPIWTEAAGVPDSVTRGGAISLNPNASFDGAMRILTYGAVFWLALHMCRSRRRAGQLLWTLTVAGSVYAAYGLAVQFSGTNTILWFEKWAYADVVTSTFVNRNSFATFAGLTIIAAFGLLTREADEAAAMGIANRAGIVHILDSMGLKLFIVLAALLVSGTALLLTASRGGIFATGLGVFAFLAGLVVYKRERLRRTIAFAGIVALGGILLLSFSGREVLVRLNQADGLSGRGTAWEMTRTAIAERPILGTGLGTFADVSTRLRSPDLKPQARPFVRAHNGYLEMLLEGGIVGFVLTMGALVWLGGWCLYGVIIRHEESIYPCVGIGALALVGTHAWVDFSLQIPAVGATFAALLAVACSQAVRHRRA